MALSVGVVILWTQLFPTQPPAPPPAAPVTGSRAAPGTAPAPAPAAPAAGTPGAPADKAGGAGESARAAAGAVDARGALRVLQPGRDAGARAIASGSNSARTRRIRRRPATTWCAPRTPPMPRCASPFRLRASRRRPTAPGKRASRRPTRSCSRPTSAPSTSRSATADKARYRLQFDVVVANRGTGTIGSKLAVSVTAPRTPTSVAAASSRAYRPTCRPRSVSSTAASNASRSRACTRARSGQGRDGAVDRGGREVPLARRGSLSRGAARARTCGAVSTGPTSAR